MKYKKYPSYKDSGVEWLGEIPCDWNLVKLKYLVSITTGNKDTENKEQDGKYPFFVRSKNVERINSYSYDGEAILTAGDGDIGKIFHYINGKFDYHQRVYMFYKFKNILVKFIYFYLQENLHKEVIKLSAKTTVDSLRLPMLQDFIISVPAVQEQQQIANFLDKATAKIDTLIKKQTKQIELLKEKRQAVISHAVTKGINPNVSMKDSGVEWLGVIPEHWEVKKLKFVLQLLNKKEKIINQIVVALENIESWSGKYIESDSSYQGDDVAFCIGDILFGKLRPYLAKVFLCSFDGIAFGDLLAYRPIKDYASKYAFYSLISEDFIKIVDSSTYGTKMPRASSEFLSEMRLTVPPLKEQQEIANYLDEKTSKIDILIEKSKKSIELLKEKRTSLISSAVTGKIDVREEV
ncbi:restriction endonuclease subunit S [Aliarcobacter cryaerophilus]|uniref:restriction endonuclease subunit S n=1 Tax=Aliarcobacter cryaerophilus TaxID=28198 RepID=UPI003DA4253E